MALTLGKVVREVAGDKDLYTVPITAVGEYATGGVSFTPNDVEMSAFTSVVVLPAAGYVFSYDATNKKVLAWRSAGSAAALQEVPNTTDLSGVATTAICRGNSK